METAVFLPFENYDIPMIVNIPDNASEKLPCLILLHGFMAYKEGDGFLFKVLAQRLAESGTASIRFDFCSMGESRGSRVKYGLGQMLKETEAVCRYAQTREDINSGRIGLLGHSLGGRTAVLSSRLNPVCIVTLNGALAESTEALQTQWKKEECMECGYAIMTAGDGNPHLLYPQFFIDMNRYHAAEAMNGYAGSTLICIGKDDPTVDPSVSLDFYRSLDPDRCQLLEIDKANHTFNAKTRDYTKVHELADHLIAWLADNLQ